MTFLSSTFKILATALILPSVAVADPLFSTRGIDWEALEDRYAGSIERDRCIKAPSRYSEGEFVYSFNDNMSVSLHGDELSLRLSFHTKDYGKSVCDNDNSLHGHIPEGLNRLRYRSF